MVVGGLIFASLASLAVELIFHTKGEGGYLALILILAAVVNAAAFTNDHWIGRHIFAVASAISGLGGLYCAVGVFTPIQLPYSDLLGAFIIISGVILMWLRSLGMLYR